MKKMVSLLMAGISAFTYSFAQETLQSVTDRGNSTTQTISTGNINSYGGSGLPSALVIGSTGTGKTSVALGTSQDAGGYSFLQSISAQGTFFGNFILSPGGGNVGIGTIDPVYKLHVNGAIGATSILHPAAGGVNAFQTGTDGDAGGWYVYEGGTGYRMVVRNGNVGIGTTTPGQLLEIKKNQDAGTFILASNEASSTSACTGVKAVAQHQTITMQANSDGLSRSYAGSHPAAASILAEASNGLNIISSNGAGTAGSNTGVIRFITYAAPGGISSIEPGNDGFTRMIVDGNGNVGINTITPTEKLSVNGNIRSKKIIVSASPWPDYVFDTSYQLAPLQQVEKYIQQNKHLPDVPSAATVAKDGVDLGDNQAVLLKKIEELTLYIIEQGKKLDEQYKRTEAQELRIKKLEAEKK